MKILVLGARGNMGRRYCAILRDLNLEVVEADIGAKWEKWDFERAIIATPTPNHLRDCAKLAQRGKSFLCEKPLSSSPREIGDLIQFCKKTGVDGRMVCNWAFALPENWHFSTPESYAVFYNCYNSGKDGLAWDCIQLIYLANGFPNLKTTSPFLSAMISGNLIDSTMIEHSYIRMVKTWLERPDKLWSLEDAKKATEKVLKYMEAHQ